MKKKMKYFAGIIAVLVVFIPQNDATPDGEMTDLFLKSREIRLSLQLYKTQLADQENKKFERVVEFLQQEASKKIDLIITEIKEKNNKDCEEALKSKLDTVKSMYVMYTEKCIKGNMPSWDTATNEIDGLVAVGEAFEAKINDIRNSCFDHNSGIFERCLEKFLPELTKSLELYQAQAAKLRTWVQIITGLGFTEFGFCFNEPSHDFWKTVNTAKEEALKCVGAEEI